MDCYGLRKDREPGFNINFHLHNVNMGSSNTKVQCLLRPGQSGKTRTVQDLIREYEGYAELFLGRDALPLNIVICSNNRHLVHQTTVRMNTDLFDESEGSELSDEGPADAQVNGSCFSWVSGTKGVISPGELAFNIITGKVSMVVCCAHKKRLDYVYELVAKLNEFPGYRSKVNIWIDEADASIKLWGKPEMDITRLSNVQTVTLVSATFNTILKKYERLRVLGYAVTHPECYHKVGDCVGVTEDENAMSGALPYLTAVLDKHPEMLVPGVRVFAPGDHVKSSHDEVASLLVRKGCAVLVLNGSEKRIRMPGGAASIVLAEHMAPEPEEIGRQVARLYREYNLSRFPFAVTGHHCVGRGLTFQNADFLFDFGVVPHISDPAMAYQTACRLAGNIRTLPGYKPATLVMASRMWQTVLRQEAFAVNLARIVKERNLPDVGVEEFDEAAGIVSTASVRDYALSLTFATSAAAAEWCDRNLSYGKSVYGLYDAEGNAGLTHIKYRGHLRPLLTEDELRASVPATNHEGGAYARVMPVMDVFGGAADAARVMPVSWVGVPEGADKARIMPVGGERVIVWIAIYKKDKRRAVTARQLLGGY
jgi:hypothetical protein